jgi:hypothetical protein
MIDLFFEVFWVLNIFYSDDSISEGSARITASYCYYLIVSIRLIYNLTFADVNEIRYCEFQ